MTGEIKTAYYYRHPKKAGANLKDIPLGTDYTQAIKKWAEMEGVRLEDGSDIYTLKNLHNDYIDWAESHYISKLLTPNQPHPSHMVSNPINLSLHYTRRHL